MKCFTSNNKNNLRCNKKDCRYWIDYESKNNCCIIAASDDKNLTLEKIGKIFGVTRMRICQIEKKAIKKIKEIIKKNEAIKPH